MAQGVTRVSGRCQGLRTCVVSPCVVQGVRRVEKHPREEPSRQKFLEWVVRSRTWGLRIIPGPPKPGTMPPFHTAVRGRRYDSTPVFLSVGADRTRLVVSEAPVCLA